MGRPKQPDNDRTLRIINSPREIAAVIKDELASAGPGPLPELTVMTSSSALVHQLRASSGGLSGAAFLFPLEVASLVLLSHGEYPGAVADPYLASLTEALISSPVLEGRLRYFKIEQFRTGADYAEALAATLSELSRRLPHGSRTSPPSGKPSNPKLLPMASLRIPRSWTERPPSCPMIRAFSLSRAGPSLSSTSRRPARCSTSLLPSPA
jgi:hypothetical protein